MKRHLWVFLALTGGAFAQQSTSVSSTSTVTPRIDSGRTQSELSTFQALGLTETDLTRYHSVLQGPRANWSEDKDPLMVLGITAETDAERKRYAQLYVVNDRKRNDAIFAFTRSVQNVWLEHYPNEPLFMVPSQAASVAPLLTATDRVILVFDANKACAQCIAAFERVQRLGRSNGGTGIDLYFVGNTFDQMVAFGRARGITKEDVSAKRVTLNQATPEIMAQLRVTDTPAAFKRSLSNIVRIELASLLVL
jgi:integrating conjugative element protein (TIGR03759 family)